MEATEATFSAAEAAVYDRQMRLWGVEAQKRLQRARVLVAGLSALGAELAKNLVLSGMGVTVQDARAVSPAAAAAQFFLSAEDVGANVRLSCALCVLVALRRRLTAGVELLAGAARQGVSAARARAEPASAGAERDARAGRAA